MRFQISYGPQVSNLLNLKERHRWHISRIHFCPLRCSKSPQDARTSTVRSPSSIQFYLFSSFIFSSLRYIVPFVPIVTFHLSPSNEKHLRWFHKCLNNKPNAFCCFVYSHGSRLHRFDFFRTIKGNEKKAIWGGNWTNDHHYHTRWLPENILTSFDVCLRPQMSFSLYRNDRSHLVSSFFIKGSLRNLLDPFLSSRCLLVNGEQIMQLCLWKFFA